MSLENPHKIAKKDGHLHEIAFIAFLLSQNEIS